MADVFSIVASAVSIAAVFTTCVDCFEFVHLGRHFGRDFQTSLLRLSCARLRLTRWGKAVDIYHDPRFGETTPETQLVKDTLLQILVLFERSAKVSARYKYSPKSSQLHDMAVGTRAHTEPCWQIGV